ncbi:hypothetical protein MMC07_004252 [Pseudocyphellaria aurata]|nr:hypothetical protein [Pseudocyphellaria aurata]
MMIVPAVKRRRTSPPSPIDDESSPSTLIDRPDEPSSNSFFANAARWNLEQNYEQRPRKQKKKEKESTRLPIKTAEGRVEQLQLSEIKDDDEGGWLGLEKGETDSELDQPVEVEEDIPEISVRQQIIEAKEELARVAGLISADPEEHAGAYRMLAQIAASENPTIKKLALVTQLAVFKDVIPGYRIRPIAESDLAEKLSKEVRRLRAYEQALVGSYQTYVKELTKLAKSSDREGSNGAATVGQVAISCACSLLLAVPHFNFRGELLKILVNKLSGKKLDVSFHKCRETIEKLFRDDEDGHASLDAVTTLTRMMKARNYRADESVLNTFLHLRLLSEFTFKASQTQVDKPTVGEKGKSAKVKKEFRTKKQRKQLKELKVVEKEFKEADAIVSHEERDRMQAETLKLVFVTYFRILKARTPALMGAVLEGLAKYAHLINQDFFGDLLEALKDLIASSMSVEGVDEVEVAAEDETEPNSEEPPAPSTSATRASLLCITTAFALLAGQDAARAASTLHLDLTFFTTHLYRSLPLLALSPDLEHVSRRKKRLQQQLPEMNVADPPLGTKVVNLQTTPSLLLHALAATLSPRPTPPVRVAAFTKQLLTMSLQLPEKPATALLALLHSHVVRTHGRKVAALWNTEETKGDGVFDPLGGDPDGSNPFAATVWEGELLRLHYCPGVREGVAGLENGIGGVG